MLSPTWGQESVSSRSSGYGHVAGKPGGQNACGSRLTDCASFSSSTRSFGMLENTATKGSGGSPKGDSSPLRRSSRRRGQSGCLHTHESREHSVARVRLSSECPLALGTRCRLFVHWGTSVRVCRDSLRARVRRRPMATILRSQSPVLHRPKGSGQIKEN